MKHAVAARKRARDNAAGAIWNFGISTIYFKLSREKIFLRNLYHFSPNARFIWEVLGAVAPIGDVCCTFLRLLPVILTRQRSDVKSFVTRSSAKNVS